MSTKPGTRSGKPRPTRSRQFSSKAIVRILITLFAGLPIATGLLVAKWFGWGVDGSLFGVMSGGIMVAVLLLVVLLLHEPYRKRKPGRASR